MACAIALAAHLFDVSALVGLCRIYLPKYSCSMPQVTVYLPADVLDAARKHAGLASSSLSSWVGGLIRDATATEWPGSLVDLLQHGSGDLVEPDDPPPEDVNLFG